VREHFRTMADREQEALRRLLLRLRIDMLALSTTQPLLSEVHRLFRQRQLRAARGAL